jgi:hypothetical protein
LTTKEHEAEQAGVEARFWTRRFRNIPPSQERRERAAGNGPRFLIADRNGRVLYLKDHVVRLASGTRNPKFGRTLRAIDTIIDRSDSSDPGIALRCWSCHVDIFEIELR